jgi:hypothetical protein
MLALSKGEKGDDGQDGEDGQDGINGADGADGLPGVDGQDGADGADGLDAPVVNPSTSNGIVRFSDTVGGLQDTPEFVVSGDGGSVLIGDTPGVKDLTVRSLDDHAVIHAHADSSVSFLHRHPSMMVSQESATRETFGLTFGQRSDPNPPSEDNARCTPILYMSRPVDATSYNVFEFRYLNAVDAFPSEAELDSGLTYITMTNPIDSTLGTAVIKIWRPLYVNNLVELYSGSGITVEGITMSDDRIFLTEKNTDVNPNAVYRNVINGHLWRGNKDLEPNPNIGTSFFSSTTTFGAFPAIGPGFAAPDFSGSPNPISSYLNINVNEFSVSENCMLAIRVFGTAIHTNNDHNAVIVNYKDGPGGVVLYTEAHRQSERDRSSVDKHEIAYFTIVSLNSGVPGYGEWGAIEFLYESDSFENTTLDNFTIDIRRLG